MKSVGTGNWEDAGQDDRNGQAVSMHRIRNHIRASLRHRFFKYYKFRKGASVCRITPEYLYVSVSIRIRPLNCSAEATVVETNTGEKKTYIWKYCL